MKRKTNKKILDEHRNIECICDGCNRPSVAHHIISKGAGGKDAWWNLMPLCNDHHNFGPDSVHNRGLLWMSRRFPAVRAYLLVRGWEQRETDLKWYWSEHD